MKQRLINALLKTANYLLVCVLIYYFTLFYLPEPTYDGHRKRPKYVPKHARTYKNVRHVSTKIMQKLSPHFSKIENFIYEICKSKSRKHRHLIIKAAARRAAPSEDRNINQNGFILPKILRREKRRRRLKNLAPLLAYSALAMSTQMGPQQQHTINFDTDSRPIGVDNRCTACISHDINDFIDPPQDTPRQIKGFGGTTHKNVKIGTIKWSWCDDMGKVHKFIIPKSYYVPNGNVRLLSPQHWAYTQERGRRNKKMGTGETTNATTCTLFWNNKSNKLSIPLSPHTNVATFNLAHGYTKYSSFCKNAQITGIDEKEIIIADESTLIEDESEEQTVPVVNPLGSDASTWTCLPVPKEHNNKTPIKLDGPHVIPTDQMTTNKEQKFPISPDGKISPTEELLKYHQKMGHISFRKLQILASEGALPKHLAKCDIPICSSCMYAKMAKRPWRHKQTTEYIPKKILDPGEKISVDQMVSPTAGFIAQLTGILTKKRYKYATVYVDQATRFGYVHLQKTATAEETLQGKKAFEIIAKNSGISVKGYHGDNGIFRANAWINDCNLQNQSMTFAGVNAHHQNGMAERRIRELQELARTMLIHANRRWNKCVTTELWPYAVRAAMEAINESPSLQNNERKSPAQLFHKTNVLANPKHFQPFGCPVYVLNNSLQANRPHHKWNERSRVGIYLGHSPLHGKNVSLVLDRVTGLVSPQFHVKYDPQFQTVKQDNFDSQWQIKAGFAEDKSLSKMFTTATSKTSKKQAKQNKMPHIPVPEGGPGILQGSEGATPKRVTWRDPNNQENPEQQNVEKDQNEQSSKRNLDKLQLQEKDSRAEKRIRPETSQNEKQTPLNGNTAEPMSLKTREGSGMSMAATPGPSNLGEGQVQNNQPNIIEAMSSEIMMNTSDCDVEGEIFCMEALFPNGIETQTDLDPLFAYKATADPDTMYMHQAMKEPDRDEFINAMQKEVTDQMENGNFSIVKTSEVPKDKTILPAVWQMKRKRDIKTRKVKKWKARLNIDGSRMKHGVHYDQTYAPVASWKSIRLLLMLTIRNGWYSKQLDYVLAFPQAPVEKEIYMKIPKGFEINGAKSGEYVLKLHKNVYGQKQAGRVWNQYLVDKLINELGFTQSKIDECVFYRGKTMYVLYTDDSLLAGPDQKEIDQIIVDLQKANLNITDEGDIQDFLGINITMRKDKSILLTQPHLIDQILKDVGMDNDNVKSKDTPALSSKILGRAKDQKDFDKSFHYRSVIGKLNYLEKGTRSDISYITHQCARFTEEPKECHGKAIRWLARYLKATRDKGLILRPNPSRNLEVFVDADFSGNWDQNDSNNRDTARSRHGYIVTYMGCPVIWKSQLQTEIALSSTESEYIGLSYALREVIPIMETLKEMKRNNFPIGNITPNIHCRVFEDNSGALEMAKTHKYRPRTKHLNVKFHHFRDYVTRGEISVHKVDTKEQCADYLTKPLNIESLKPLRKMIMGW